MRNSKQLLFLGLLPGLLSGFLAAGLLYGGDAAAQSKTVTFAGFGGVTQEAERKTLLHAAEKNLGVTIREDKHGDFGGVKAHVLSGNVTWDIVGIGFSICAKSVRNGLVEKLDYSLIDTTGVEPKFVTPYCLGTWTYSYGISYRTDKFGKNPPKTWAEFWDVKKFPGRRSLWGNGRYVLEAALMADGVPRDKVYETLSTEKGVDRAFAKLAEIKPHINVWWSSIGSAMQLLRDGEVDLIQLANGRIDALAKDGAPVAFEYNEAVMDAEAFLVPKGAPNASLAMKVISETLKPEPQARFALELPFGPANVNAYKTGLITPEVAAKLPTHPNNLDRQLAASSDWYASDIGEAALTRFARFIQQ